MKVVLRNPNAPDGRHFWSLTLGAQYEVLAIECDDYRLLDDTGEPILFDADCFDVSDQQEQEFWVSRFGADGERYAGPGAWHVPGFFEDWHEGVETVRKQFADQLARWYPDVAALSPKRPNPYSASYAFHFRERGCAVFPSLLDAPAIERLRAAVEATPDGEAVHRKQNVYGVRNLFDSSPEVRALAASDDIRQFVTPILGENCFASRVVFFDKVPGANWALGWHQDNVICVRERKDVPGFVAWGEKAGVWQVQPPVEIISSMVAVRVHLDDCGSTNGPLRVLPGSHCHGWLDDEIDRWKRDVAPVECLAKAGGVVVMSPTILHASSRAEVPSHRRVLHFEFANQELPGGLEWNWRIGSR